MIRVLEKNDIPFVNKLINDENYIINEYELKKNAKVYELNGKIIAFISFIMLYERAELNYIFVDSEYRNQKIASTLIENMLDDCLKADVKKIDLEVKCSNKAAIKLYEKYNFKIVSIRKNYYNGIDALLMVKEVGE